ncbi:MAG: FimB/Mfa2 family fimbrial subunit [Bacteroidales bacterium]|nr:FimB/Mfa2 family fimbrial subunit [Candidatus Physcousia equi]
MRSYYVIGLIALGMLVSSCQGGNEISPNEGVGQEEQSMAQSEKTFSFSVTNYEQQSLSDVSRSSASGTVLPHLALCVFNAEGKQVRDIRQATGEEGYGTFSLTLPYGEYTILAIGHSGTRAMRTNGIDQISFEENHVPDCFVKTLSLKVDSTTPSQQPLTLSRCVACFTVKCSNGIPDEMMAMEYEAEGGGIVLNGLTGYCYRTEKRTGRIDFSGTKNRNTTQTINLYAFLPAAEGTMTFTLRAVDGAGEVLQSRTFSDVSMRHNLRTIYTGDFFTNTGEEEEKDINSSFTIQLADYDWEEVNTSF